ncbi:MAG TPA: hypothetical protein VIF15_02890 [Polyangiaceae bacterium]|jgi:hypothetical protein
MSRTTSRVHGWLVVATLVAGCGGSTFAGGGDAAPGGDSGAGTDGGGGGDDGGGAVSPCPASPPSSGSACAPQGLSCEWGSSTVQSCDTVAFCNGGRWQVTAPNPGGLDCGGGPQGQCPGSFAAVPRQTHCSPYLLACDYPQGRCACTIPAAGAQPADASAVAEWLCQDPAAGCPQPRPPLGSPCAQEGLDCDYGACTIPGGNAETCHGGIWTEGGVACPAMAGR